jgi:hypothetical protein
MNRKYRAIVGAAIIASVALMGPQLTPGQTASQTTDAAAADALPEWYRRGLPGPGQEALEPLIGTWRQHKEIYGTLGRDPNAPPLVSDDVTTRRQWMPGGRFIEDITEGTVDSQPYWRKGLLGYSNMDARYDWVTIDIFNATMMIYRGEPNSGPGSPIVMSGVFTDQGVAGEAAVGKTIPMRTVITIESPDKHMIELFFTPPGGKEVLADRTTYSRLSK